MKKVLIALSLLAGCTGSSLPEDPTLIHPQYHVSSCLDLRVKPKEAAAVLATVDITVVDVGSIYYVVDVTMKDTKELVNRQLGSFLEVEAATVEIPCAK
jgi:hypothetical protein